jgi:hypothetical protein
MAIDPKRLADFADVVARGGTIMCAADVYPVLAPALDEAGLADVKVVVHPWFSPGVIAAVEPPRWPPQLIDHN